MLVRRKLFFNITAAHSSQFILERDTKVFCRFLDNLRKLR